MRTEEACGATTLLLYVRFVILMLDESSLLHLLRKVFIKNKSHSPFPHPQQNQCVYILLLAYVC